MSVGISGRTITLHSELTDVSTPHITSEINFAGGIPFTTAYQLASTDNIYHNNSSEKTESASAVHSEVLIKEIQIPSGTKLPAGSTLSIYFECKVSTGTGTFQIWRNGGAPYGTLRTTTSTSYVNYTESITNVQPGDRIQIYCARKNDPQILYCQKLQILGTGAVRAGADSTIIDTA
jgi:hypothetical protein